MLRNLLLTIGIILTSSVLVFSQSGTLQGKVLDKDTGEPIPFANIVIELGGSQEGGTTTDFEGNYTIKPIDPGQYNVRASYVGYQPVQQNNVIIRADQITFLDLEMTSQAQNLEEVVITDYKVPLISKDKTSSGGTMTSEEIEKMPNKNAEAIATSVGGVFSEDGEVSSIRGQREEGTVYYIDGIKVTGGTNLPESSIDQVSVILGGVPAQYGDATGGIINITTKGPSRDFGAGFSAQSSEYLDAYGYNRLGLNLNGPLLKKKDGNSSTSLLGYYLSGEVIYKDDGRPTATGVDKVKDDVLQDLIANPFSVNPESGAIVNNSALLREDAFEHMDATQNTNSTRVNLSGKLDIKTTPTVNLTLGGNMSYTDYNSFNYQHSLFNWQNNRQVTSNTTRGFVRFTNRFPNTGKEDALITNTYLSFQADFSRIAQTIQHPVHKDNLFDYGYVGQFTTYKERNYTNEMEYDSVAGVYAHRMDNWNDTLVSFVPGTDNEARASYTSTVYDAFDSPIGNYDNKNNITSNGGLLNSNFPDDVYGLWANVGASQADYDYYEVMNDQIGLDLKVSTDIGNHAVRFGLSYEQRRERFYGYNAGQLWQQMRDLTNAHIQQLDLDNPQPVYLDGQFMDTINYPRLYDGNAQRHFDEQLRQAMGLEVAGTEWIDIDSYNREEGTISYYDDNGNQHITSLNRDLSIEMFSPDELLNSGSYMASAYGFDYYGNVLENKPGFSDFFSATDENNINTRNIGAFEPIYTAGFIQDKFAFKDLIFNIGVRVDRFDANQMVLKDPFLLFPAYRAGEVRTNEDLMLGNIPGSIGDDYAVYVDDAQNPSAFTGFRDGNTWFDASGTEVADPESALSSGSGIQPYLQDPGNDNVSAEVFEDYEPQINVMPRIAFSFPISDEALFFAHYDVLTQRPKNNLRMNPATYFFMSTSGGGTASINNPNLKPEQTIDYELGFQQKLSNTSSLIISAFYREIRDQIQSYRFTGAYPTTYYSYNNLDFGTVKGLTVTYDLRRTKNIRMKTSYTLQFAEGTGSNTETAKALILSGQPNLRTLLPLNIDRRHAINMMLDYRFGEGKNYNGPTSTRNIEGSDKVKTIQWLKNTGVNFTLNGGSGTPYTKSSRIYPLGGQRVIQGSINGARKPSQWRIDMRMDRDIDLVFGADENKRGASLNLYLQVLNLFNTMNVLNVYSATGNANDDGYLAADEWQSNINDKLDSQAYRNMYMMRINSPFNYSAPRQIRLGVELNF